LIGFKPFAAMLNVSHEVIQAFSPTGKLRASINLGNTVIAGRNARGEPAGVSVDLARAFGETLGVPVELVLFNTARDSVAAVAEHRADIGFFAVDPQRSRGIGFSPPYVLIEGCYQVRYDSGMKHADAVDKDGMRVAVGRGTAYDLFLSRSLQHADLVRTEHSADAVRVLLSESADAVAGVRQMLEADLYRYPGLRMLAGRFMLIRQAMGCPLRAGPAAVQLLTAFVEDMRANGFVADALSRHGITGAVVACAGD
jgi:polar amino acid transport system substrate-binding protein